jgi:hypothetical protein
MIWALEDRVFPDPHDPPAGGFKKQRLTAIPRYVLHEFPCPKLISRSRPDIVLRTPVPETAVDEHRESLGSEYKIWTNPLDGAMQAVPKPLFPE